MPLKNSTKNYAAFLLGVVWSVGMSIFAVYSVATDQNNT